MASHSCSLIITNISEVLSSKKLWSFHKSQYIWVLFPWRFKRNFPRKDQPLMSVLSNYIGLYRHHSDSLMFLRVLWMKTLLSYWVTLFFFFFSVYINIVSFFRKNTEGVYPWWSYKTVKGDRQAVWMRKRGYTECVEKTSWSYIVLLTCCMAIVKLRERFTSRVVSHPLSFF